MLRMWVPVSVIVVIGLLFLRPVQDALDIAAKWFVAGLFAVGRGIGMLIGAEKPRSWWSALLLAAVMIGGVVGVAALLGY